MSRLNEKGQEVLDPTPIAVPTGLQRPPTLQEQIARHMRAASLLASRQGLETFEEADDFDVGDDHDPHSPWELKVDEISGKEYLPAELEQIQRDRAEFDSRVKASRKKRRKQSEFVVEEPTDAPRQGRKKVDPPASPEGD